MKKKLFLSAMLLVLAVMLASCGGGSKAEEEKPIKNAKEAWGKAVGEKHGLL